MCPPGANYNKLSLFTWQVSIPGRFLAALLTYKLSSPYTMSGPLLVTYLPFLAFPLPDLNFLLSLAFFISAPNPYFNKAFNKSLVVSTFNESTTKGTSGNPLSSCPLAINNGAHPLAANADAAACLF